MSNNYAKPLPKDRSGIDLQEFPSACSAIGTRATDNATASSVMNLTNNTTTIEVAAINGTGFIKWTTAALTASVISAAGTANFDHVVPIGTFRRFVVPRLTMASDGVTSIASGYNTGEGLFNAVAVKTNGVGSVLLTEY